MFLWSNNNLVDPSTQYSKICVYVPKNYKSSCLNHCQTFDRTKCWESHVSLDNLSENVLKTIANSNPGLLSHNSINNLKLDFEYREDAGYR